jgi:peptidoglycan/LPS O-acetylase OafA/YrhL
VAFLLRYPIAAFFLCGAVIRLLYDRGIAMPLQWARPLELVALGACVLFASTNHFAYSASDMMSGYLPWAIMVSTALYFFLAVQSGSLTSMALNNRFWIYLGTVSYSLYLLHPYTYYITRAAFVKWDLFAENWLPSMILFFVVTTPITVAITHFVHKWFEVRPYRYYFKQRIYRAPDSSDA